jgi:dienelactone hydrolase
VAENQSGMNRSNNRNMIIRTAVVGVLLIIGVVAVSACSNQEGVVAPTATVVAMEVAATATPEDEATEEPEEPTATVTEEPTEEPTAEPTEEPTEEPPALPPDPQDISFQASDGQELQGRYYPGASASSPVIILMHWAPGTMEDWNEIAFWLQNRGLGGSSSNLGSAPWLDPSWFPTFPAEKSYAVFTFNFRDGSREGMLLDAQAAFNTVRGLEGVDVNKIASFGASIGADGAPDGCAWHNENFEIGCLGALSLSPGSYLTVPYNEVVDKLGAEMPPKPVWCFYAADDSASAQACQSATGDHYRMVEWTDGRWHGMELVDPARDPNALVLILEWLALLGL